MKPIPEQHQFQWLNWLSQTNIQINKWEKNVSRVEMTHDWTYILNLSGNYASWCGNCSFFRIVSS